MFLILSENFGQNFFIKWTPELARAEAGVEKNAPSGPHKTSMRKTSSGGNAERQPTQKGSLILAEFLVEFLVEFLGRIFLSIFCLLFGEIFCRAFWSNFWSNFFLIFVPIFV
jgi:hypothetical protein